MKRYAAKRSCRTQPQMTLRTLHRPSDSDSIVPRMTIYRPHLRGCQPQTTTSCGVPFTFTPHDVQIAVLMGLTDPQQYRRHSAGIRQDFRRVFHTHTLVCHSFPACFPPCFHRVGRRAFRRKSTARPQLRRAGKSPSASTPATSAEKRARTRTHDFSAIFPAGCPRFSQVAIAPRDRFL